MEEFSENLGFRNAHILKERQLWRSQGGPGTYDVNEDLFKKKSSSHAENAGMGREKRFYSVIKYDAPPPGRYSNEKNECALDHTSLALFICMY